MKRFIIALVCVFCVSCKDAEPKAELSAPIETRRIFENFGECAIVYVVEGHEYLFVKRGYGAGLVHLESCPCKNK